MTHYHLKKAVKCELTHSGKLKPEYRVLPILCLEEDMQLGGKKVDYGRG